MNRRERERLAMIALAIWSPFDLPEAPDEVLGDRAAALRRWRGQEAAIATGDESAAVDAGKREQ